MADIMDILGGGLPPGLLSQEQEAMARQRAQQAGLTNLGFALLQASQGQPGQRKPSFGQIIGQAGPVGMQAYQQSFDKTLSDLVKGMQIKELMAKQQEEERQRKARSAFEQAITGAKVTLPTAQAFRSQQTNIEPDRLESMSDKDVAKEAISAGLPTQQVMNQTAADQAVMDYLRVASPVEYAKIIAKEPRALPAGIQEYAFAKTPEGGGFKGTFQEFLQSKTPSTNVSLSTEKTYGGALAGEVAKSDAAKFEAASSAPRVIETAKATRQLLDSGNVITGIGAQQRLDFARFGQLLGVTGQNTNELVANTQQLFANRAQATLDSIRASGLGAGQGFSNKDREFLENAKLGNITYSPEALKRQLDIEERVARASVESWNKRLENIPSDARKSLGLNTVQLTVPPPSGSGIKTYNPRTGRVE